MGELGLTSSDGATGSMSNIVDDDDNLVIPETVTWRQGLNVFL